MTSYRLYWYRVETDHEGNVISVQLAARPEDDGGLTLHFVRARDTEHAENLGRRAYARARQRQRRAEYVREGKCPYCGRQQDRQKGRRCSRCLANDNVYQKRRQAKQRGEVVAPLSKKASLAARRAEDDQQVYLAAFLEAQRAWQRALNNKLPGGYTRWLKNRIAFAESKVKGKGKAA